MSPAPTRIPSRTYSSAPTGWVAATTTARDQTRSWTAGSAVNIGTYAGRRTISSAAMASPLPSPHPSARDWPLRAAGSAAPSAWPTMACLAIANASGGMASRYHSVNAIWWLASATSPWLRRRTSSSARRPQQHGAREQGTFAAAAAKMPGRSGRSGRRCLLAPRTTTAHSQRRPRSGRSRCRAPSPPRRARAGRRAPGSAGRWRPPRPGGEQRRTCVLQSPQRPCRGQDDEHRRQAEQADPR